MLSGKTLAEGGLRVPWLVRPDPGLDVPVGIRIDQVTSAIDLAPTLIELSGLRVPEGMHGISHRDAVFGEDADLREHAFAAGGSFSGFAVMGKESHFTRQSRDSLAQPSLHRSYFGLDPTAESAALEPISVEAVEPLTGSPLQLSPERLEELTLAGQDWFRWIQKTRDVVQGIDDDVETRTELVRRGLLKD